MDTNEVFKTMIEQFTDQARDHATEEQLLKHDIAMPSFLASLGRAVDNIAYQMEVAINHYETESYVAQDESVMGLLGQEMEALKSMSRELEDASSALKNMPDMADVIKRATRDTRGAADITQARDEGVI